jgi:hypothetical protein
MRVILAKLLWTFDMELKDEKLDWLADSESRLLWQKPGLHLNFTRRDEINVPPLGA